LKLIEGNSRIQKVVEIDYTKMHEIYLILPVDLAQERCLVTIFLTSLTPRALEVHTTDNLSENLKTQDGASAAGGAPTLKSVTRTPKN